MRHAHQFRRPVSFGSFTLGNFTSLPNFRIKVPSATRAWLAFWRSNPRPKALYASDRCRGRSRRAAHYPTGSRSDAEAQKTGYSRAALFPALTLSTRQYIRLVKSWIALIGLEAAEHGSHSLRRTKVSMLYRKTGNLRAWQLLLGHTKLESTVRYLGVELDDALALSEALEI